MNLYFVHADGSIVTPELTGTILEGVTRSSILDLGAELGHKVEERRVSIDEWREGVASGEITEVFACGTAAVITPLGRLTWDGGELAIGESAGAVKIFSVTSNSIFHSAFTTSTPVVSSGGTRCLWTSARMRSFFIAPAGAARCAGSSWPAA